MGLQKTPALDCLTKAGVLYGSIGWYDIYGIYDV